MALMRTLRLLFLLLYDAAGVAPPSSPVRPAAPPSHGLISQRLGANARKFASTAPFAAGFRGQPLKAAALAGWRTAEVALKEALSSTSPTSTAMYYEAETLQLSTTANGDPSVAAILDFLEYARPPSAAFEMNKLVGKWRLEYTSDLTVALRNAMARHIKDRVVSLSIVMSISEDGATDTTATASLVGGEQQVMNLHYTITQREQSPVFWISARDGGQVFAEVTYVSDDILILRKDGEGHFDQVPTSNGLAHSSTSTDVWSRLEKPSQEVRPTKGISLWRFGLSYSDVFGTANIDQKQASQPPYSPSLSVSEWLLFALLFTAAFVAVGGRLWRYFGQFAQKTCFATASSASSSVIWPQRQAFALAGFAGQAVNKSKVLRDDLTWQRHTNSATISEMLEPDPESADQIDAPRLKLSQSVSRRAPISAAVAMLSGPHVAAAAQEEDIEVYFGCGCFWHVQHEFVQAERKILQRDDLQLTALSGYAGGNGGVRDGKVCYHNALQASDYGSLGHAEVVRVKIPPSKFKDFVKEYVVLFDEKGFRPDQFGDRGPEYRNVVGIPGGAKSPLAQELIEVSAAYGDKLDFAIGKGSDNDVPKTAFILDSKQYPFYQAEIYHQFHDGFNQGEDYPGSYNSLTPKLLKAGRVIDQGCPNGLFGIGIAGL